MNLQEELDRAHAMLAIVLLKLGEPVVISEEDRRAGIPEQAEIVVTSLPEENSIAIGMSTYE